MNLRKRIKHESSFTIRCSYCGAQSRTTELKSLDEAARFFERSGWQPHPRLIIAALCQRCATLYPDTNALDVDIEGDIPF